MKPTKKWVLWGAVALLIAGAAYYKTAEGELPPGIHVSNGRMEAQSVDVAARNGGRILTLAVEEGAMVEAGDVLATLDLNHLAASVEGAKAQVRVAVKQERAAAAGVAQAESAYALAKKEHARTSRLVKEGAVSRSRNDQAVEQAQTAQASLVAAQQRLEAAKASVAAAQAEVSRQEDLLADKEIKAPIAGRVLYKLAEPGEVIAAGGKVVTLLDLTDVYMTVFYPMEVAGKLRLGDAARIVLDALPETVIPATVSYVSPEAQFTPRQVETKSEREKMMFRVKVRVPKPLLEKHRDAVKTGLPGVAYVRTENAASWPEFLAVKPSIARASKQ